MNPNLQSLSYESYCLKMPLPRQQEFFSSVTGQDLFTCVTRQSKPLEDSFQINGRFGCYPFVEATSSSDRFSSSTLQFRVGVPKRKTVASKSSRKRSGEFSSRQNKNYGCKYVKGTSLVEPQVRPLLIDLTDLSDEDNCPLVEVSSNLSDEEEVPLEPIPLGERILQPDTPEILQRDTAELAVSYIDNDNYDADVTNVANIPLQMPSYVSTQERIEDQQNCAPTNASNASIFNFYTTTNIERFKSLPAFQPKVVLKKLSIGDLKNAKGVKSCILRNSPTLKKPPTVKESPALKRCPTSKFPFIFETTPVSNSNSLFPQLISNPSPNGPSSLKTSSTSKATPVLNEPSVLKMSSLSTVPPTLKGTPISKQLPVLKKSHISKVSITSMETIERSPVEKNTKIKINESVFISEELDTFLKYEAQLENTELKKVDKNIIPKPADDPIFSLGQLKAKEQ